MLEDIVNRALTFYDAFMNEYDGQRRASQANKIVGGRISGGPNHEPVDLLADPERGLYGFRSPPGDEPPPAEQPSGRAARFAGLRHPTID